MSIPAGGQKKSESFRIKTIKLTRLLNRVDRFNRVRLRGRYACSGPGIVQVLNHRRTKGIKRRVPHTLRTSDLSESRQSRGNQLQPVPRRTYMPTCLFYYSYFKVYILHQPVAVVFPRIYFLFYASNQTIHLILFFFIVSLIAGPPPRSDLRGTRTLMTRQL